jgi:hypothetical protein
MRSGLIIPAVATVAFTASCQGVIFMGNLAVLAVTLGIFVGTLSLGRSR